MVYLEYSIEYVAIHVEDRVLGRRILLVLFDTPPPFVVNISQDPGEPFVGANVFIYQLLRV